MSSVNVRNRQLKDECSIDPELINKTASEATIERLESRNKNIVPVDNQRRQVFSTHKN